MSKLLAGNRKFIVTAACGLVTTGLLVFGKLSMVNYTDIIKTVLVAYMSSNIGEHTVNLFKERSKK